ncbi:MAG: hypothetical protein PHY47_27945 [Lachnospiraceae bacterium]|nr:hypothetical protein [Lachnospiraceae bacterium]
MEKLLKNKKIKGKLTTSFTWILAFLIVCVITAFVGLTFVSINMKQFHDEAYQNSVKQMEVRKNLQAVAKYILWAAATEDEAGTAEQVENANKYLTEATEGLTYLEENFDAQDLVSELSSEAAIMSPISEKVMEYAAANDNANAQNTFINEYALDLCQYIGHKKLNFFMLPE